LPTSPAPAPAASSFEEITKEADRRGLTGLDRDLFIFASIHQQNQ
jgi:hypothetical protein